MPLQSTKRFVNFPIAHRDCFHKGNCALLHGYSISFELTFAASHQNKSGHIMDYGDLKSFHNFLQGEFDHTLWLNSADPLLPKFRELEEMGACIVKTADRICMEETAAYVFDCANEFIKAKTDSRVWVVKVQAWENEFNSAIYSE